MGLSHLIPGIELATPGHLGTTRDDQAATAEFLGVRLLSSRYEVKIKATGELAIPPQWESDFVAVQRRLHQSLGQGRDEEGDANKLLDRDEHCPTLILRRYQRIDRVILDQSREVSSEEVGAALIDDKVAVAGTPFDFAPDLTTILFERWGLGSRRDLVTLMPRYVLLLARIGEGSKAIIAPLAGEEDHGASQLSSEHSEPSATSQNEGSGPGVGPADSITEPRPRSSPSSSHTPEDREGLIRSLQRQLDRLRAVGLVPDCADAADTNTDAPGQFGEDDAFRRAAMEFEIKRGRFPQEKPPRQAGHDVDSYSHDVGHPERLLVRRIEVKGRSSRWQGDQSVELSDRQFRDALAASLPDEPAAPDFEYWLYVVEPLEGGRHNVIPIRNPARAAKRFELRGGTWRDLGEGPAR